MRDVISGRMVREDPSEVVIHRQRCDRGDRTQHGTRVEFMLTVGSLVLREGMVCWWEGSTISQAAFLLFIK